LEALRIKALAATSRERACRRSAADRPTSKSRATPNRQYANISPANAPQIVVTSEGLSIFRSYTAVTAVVEALHLAVLHLSDQTLNERMAAATELFEEFDVYRVQTKKSLRNTHLGPKKPAAES